VVPGCPKVEAIPGARPKPNTPHPPAPGETIARILPTLWVAVLREAVGRGVRAEVPNPPPQDRRPLEPPLEGVTNVNSLVLNSFCPLSVRC